MFYSMGVGGRARARWWFQIFFMFIPKIGEDEPISTHIFQISWFNHQPV